MLSKKFIASFLILTKPMNSAFTSFFFKLDPTFEIFFFFIFKYSLPFLYFIFFELITIEISFSDLINSFKIFSLKMISL